MNEMNGNFIDTIVSNSASLDLEITIAGLRCEIESKKKEEKNIAYSIFQYIQV